MYAGSSTGNLFRSTDEGLTWTIKKTGLPLTYIQLILEHKGNLFAGTPVGVYVSTNRGETWSAANTGLSFRYTYSLWANDTYLFAGFLGNGVWRRPLSDMVVGLGDEWSGVPTRIELSQNYPNPFNPATIIRFQLPMVGNVRVAVYDVLGREVSVLVNERKDAGVHSIRFDGTGLSSGVYFCRLTAGGIVLTQKMVLSK